MGRVAVVFTCSHTTPEVDNSRFDILGKFIYDLKPDYVIDLGDGADMKSLNTYDTRSPKAVVAQSYQADIEQYNDAQDRMRHLFRHHKRKRPYWIGFEGNHENRIKKAISVDPRVEGDKYGISFSHLQTDHWFDDYHEYEYGGPAVADYDGISYAHYFSSGNYGTATSGQHHAYTILNNRLNSSTCGHSHKRSIYFKDGAHPNGAIGLVAGCFKGAKESWAAQANNEWWTGVVVKREIENGMYEPQFISLKALEQIYG
jgi:hypothetical protein